MDWGVGVGVRVGVGAGIDVGVLGSVELGVGVASGWAQVTSRGTIANRTRKQRTLATMAHIYNQRKRGVTIPSTYPIPKS